MDLVTAIITLLVGTAILITGMDLMSNGLKKATGKGLKRLLKKTKNNGFACLGIGCAATALTQSSAATSVMAIGFVSAGVMTIFQALAITFGGYIGTTVTGVLASLSSFSISSYFVLLAPLGVILMFFKKEKIKNIGEICLGLGMLFFGLSTMKQSIENCEELYSGIKTFFSTVNFPLLLVLIGAAFAALVQSSSATATVVISLIGAQSATGTAFSLKSGFFLLIGATIGTLVTTILASIGSGVNSKRVALGCAVERIAAAIIGIAIVWPLGDYIADGLTTVFKDPKLVLAMFLVIYNIVLVLLSMPFTQAITKLVTTVIKDKDLEKNKKALKFIDKHLLDTPTIATSQVKKEIINMMQLSFENYKNGYQRLMQNDSSVDKTLIEIEDNIDYINSEISNFLINLTNRVSLEDEARVGSYFHVINDIERIGDHAYNFYEMSLSMNENDLEFSDIAKQEMSEMNEVIVQMFEIALYIFERRDSNKLKQLHELEDKTDRLKSSLSQAHFDRITKKQCKNELSPYYSTLVSELERVADHLVNIGYSIDNPTGNADK